MKRLNALVDRYRVAVDPLRSERRIELVLVVLVCLLMLQLLYVAVRLTVGFAPEPVAPAPDTLQVRAGSGIVAVDAEARREIRARPLFWEGRRPLEQVAASEIRPEEKPAGRIDGVKLVGIFGSGDTAGAIALVKERKQRIFLGEELNGWTLEKVEPTGVVLVNGERREELLLLQREVIAPPPPAPGNAGIAHDDGAKAADASGGSATAASGGMGTSSTATPRSIPGLGIRRSSAAINGKE